MNVSYRLPNTYLEQCQRSYKLFYFIYLFSFYFIYQNWLDKNIDVKDLDLFNACRNWKK